MAQASADLQLTSDLQSADASLPPSETQPPTPDESPFTPEASPPLDEPPNIKQPRTKKRRRKLRFGRTSSELFLESVQSPSARPLRHPHTAAAEAPVHQDEQRLPKPPPSLRMLPTQMPSLTTCSVLMMKVTLPVGSHCWMQILT